MLKATSINQSNQHLAGLASEGEAAAVADLDAVEETARLGQELQHVGQRQEGDIPGRKKCGKNSFYQFWGAVISRFDWSAPASLEPKLCFWNLSGGSDRFFHFKFFY